MKSLVLSGSIDSGSGCMETQARRLHVVAVLKPEENGDQSNGWVLVVTSKGHSTEKRRIKGKIRKDFVGDLTFSTQERFKLLQRSLPEEIYANQDNLCMGQFMLFDHASGKSLKIRSISDCSPDNVEFFTITISKSEQMDLLENQKCKLVGMDEYGDHHVFLVPRGPLSNLGNVTSGPVLRGMETTAERILMRLEQRLLKSEHIPLIFSRKQWKSFMGCVATWQERLWAKNKDGRGILRWIKRRSRADTEFETEEEEEEAPLEADSEKRKLVRKALIKKKKQQKKGKGDNDKVNRINFAGDKKTMRGEEDYADEEGDKDKQLIKIELKPDPLIQDSSFQFCSGDLLRLKVTKFADYDYDEYEVEIDFVQNFFCEANTSLDRCRSRRITNLLERAIFQDLLWEKGMHISGQQFTLCWIPYSIPLIDNSQEGFAESCLDSSKFKVAGSEYQLQIRLYGTDQEKVSRCALSTCIFPLIMPKKQVVASSTIAAA